jgi:hypothetical protein
MPQPTIVSQNIDTFITNVRITSDFPEDLAAQLEDLKRRSQEAEEDIPTPWRFAGEALFIKPHGAGRQWRWILHSPSIHVEVGLGKLTRIIVKARTGPSDIPPSTDCVPDQHAITAPAIRGAPLRSSQ